MVYWLVFDCQTATGTVAALSMGCDEENSKLFSGTMPVVYYGIIDLFWNLFILIFFHVETQLCLNLFTWRCNSMVTSIPLYPYVIGIAIIWIWLGG